MKIISYNISSYTQEKINQLFDMKADVYIVPEIACLDKITIPPEYEMEWNSYCPTKGLGVIWRKGRGKTAAFFKKELSYAIPIIYEDIFILGIWPTKLQKNEKYKDVAMDLLNYYSPYFTSKTIITGDFNLFCKKDSNHEADLTPINDFLIKHEFESLYHKKYSEEPGSEKAATFFFHNKENQPYFLDYTYANFPAVSYKLKDFGRDFSDHVGQIVEI